MPVRFETTSNDNANLSADSKLPIAGRKSIELANLSEPQLQSRRKPIDLMNPSAIYKGGAPDGGGDYFLVGDQSKFAPNVKYMMPSRGKENIPVDHVTEYGDHKRVLTAERSPPQAPREPVLSAVPKESHIAPAPRERDIAPVPKRKPDNYIPRPTKPIIKSRPPIKSQKQPHVRSDVPRHAAKVKNTKLSLAHGKPPHKGHSRHPPVPKLSLGSELESEVSEQRTHVRKLKESAQKKLDTGVANPGKEVPHNYAMKYRAGCAPSRPQGPKRLSEYQMQFQWKKGVASSPLLAAEQMVYNSNPYVAPYSNPQLPVKRSEYNQAYKSFNFRPPPAESVEPKKAKLQRSKSMEALTPDKVRAAGMRSGRRTTEDKRLLRESANPTRILFPHGKVKYVDSEYAMNYRDPTRYAYDDGVWRGADPPHIQNYKTPVPIVSPPPAGSNEEPNATTSWYNEVLELRNKAMEYKHRARGTHFSREHLAQLYAQQADLWDTVSNSSTLSALSLESAGALVNKRGAQMNGRTQKQSSQSKATPPKQAWDRPNSLTECSKATSEVSVQGSPPGSVGMVIDELDATGSKSSHQGRLPTPIYRKEHDSAGYKWRHHLDRTTPAVGGALLTSPPPRKKTMSRSKSENASKSAQLGTKVSKSWPGPMVSSGLPTRDTHVLVDEEASTDRPLTTKFTESPPIDKHAKKHPLGVSIMPTLRETLREMNSNSTAATVNDDAVSLSARSMASSCSLASEVLERARNRRDEFWGNTKDVSRS